jgi:hypothetical protein
MAEIHLAALNRLFKQTEPALWSELMTSEKLEDLQLKQNRTAERLQRIVNALAGTRFDRLVEEAFFKLPSPKDESQPVAAYEQVLERMDKFAEQQELLLQEAGILPGRED